MNNNSLIITIILIAILLIGGWFVWSNYMSDNGNYNFMQGSRNEGDKGTLYVLVTDAAANMQNISEANMTVDKISVHSQAKGWVDISTSPQTFNLLALKASAKSALAARADLAAGTYDQIRFNVTKIAVTESGKVKEAKLPSGELKMSGIIKVDGDTDSSAVIDVLADQSLHKTGKGEFIFTPVVKIETRTAATVTADANNLYVATEGTVHSDTTMGMDVNGEVKNNFKLDTNATLEINGGVIQVKPQGSTQLKANTQTQGNINTGY